jgi:hypothetical protein
MQSKISNVCRTISALASGDEEDDSLRIKLEAALSDPVTGRAIRLNLLNDLFVQLEETIHCQLDGLRDSNSDTELIGSLFFCMSEIIHYLMIFTEDELLEGFSNFFCSQTHELTEIEANILDSLCATVGHINSVNGSQARTTLAKLALLDLYVSKFDKDNDKEKNYA